MPWWKPLDECMLSIHHPPKYPSGADPHGILNFLQLAARPEGGETIIRDAAHENCHIFGEAPGQTFLRCHRDTVGPSQAGRPPKVLPRTLWTLRCGG